MVQESRTASEPMVVEANFMARGAPGAQIPAMTDEDFERVFQVLEKMSDMQIRTLFALKRMQAQVMALQGQVSAIQLNQGVDPEELKKQVREERDRLDGIAQDEVKSWLADRGIAHPIGDDPWWDRPRE